MYAHYMYFTEYTYKYAYFYWLNIMKQRISEDVIGFLFC